MLAGACRRRRAGRPGPLPGRRRLTPAPAVIDEQDRLKVATHRGHQLATAGHRAGHHVLMRVDRGRADLDQPDQAALHVPGTALLIDVQGGRVVHREHAVVQPVAQPRGGELADRPRVGAVGVPRGSGAGLGLGQDEPDDVVRRGRAQALERARVRSRRTVVM